MSSNSLEIHAVNADKEHADYSITVKLKDSSDFFDNLFKLRLEERFIDVIINIQGKKFPVHRAVLASNSSYFDKMFQFCFVEGKSIEINLNEILPQVFSNLLDYMYGQFVVVDSENAANILLASSFLCLDSLKKAASVVCSKNINIDNCLIIRYLSISCFCEKLLQHSDYFIKDHFEAVRKTDEFLKLDFKSVKEYISSSEVVVNSEISILEAALSWLHKGNNWAHLDCLFSTIQFNCIPVPYLKALLDKDEALRSHTKWAEILTNIIVNSDNVSVPILCNRGESKLLFLYNKKNNTSSPMFFDFSNLSWHLLGVKTKESVPLVVNSVAACLSNSIFLVGGEWQQNHSSSSSFSKKWTLRLKNGVKEYFWEHLENSDLLNRKSHQVANVLGVCYVIGGIVSHSNCPTDSVEKFEFATNFMDDVSELRESHQQLLNTEALITYNKSTKMLNKRSSFACCTLVSNKILVLGGWNGNKCLNSIEMFDTYLNTWSLMNFVIPVARMKLSACSIDQKVYIAGGTDQTWNMYKSFDCLDLADGTWSQLPDMNYARVDCVLIPYRSNIYAFGGEGSEGTIECFDVMNNTWKVLDKKVQNFDNCGYTGVLVNKPLCWNAENVYRF